MSIEAESAEGFAVENGRVAGIVTDSGRIIQAGAVVLTTGTFLHGLIHCGEERIPAGRVGEAPSHGLAEAIEKAGFSLGRLKTGTPPRLDGRTIDYSGLTVQPGDNPPIPFSYLTAKAVLVDEHLATLVPLYREAARLLRAGGRFVLIGYHPHFLMLGIPTHFDRPSGEPVAIECHVHLTSDHIRAAHGAGLRLVEMDEGVVDEAWIEAKTRWAAYRHQPVSFAMVWAKDPA